MKMKSIALLTVALLLAGKAYPYSHDGHYLVGAIADDMLAGTPTAAKVKNLIGSVKLATAANFADALRGWDPDVTTNSKPFKVTTNKKLNADLKAFLAANQSKPSNCLDLLHHEYHYTDIEVFDSTTYSDTQTGANNNDVVHMISFCIDVLTGARSADNPQKITPRVALVLLVHYVGDIHQPLHVGAEYFDHIGNPINPNTTIPFAPDAGGNSLTLTLTNSSVSVGKLHHYWDSNAVATATSSWANQINPSNPHSVKLGKIATFLKNNLPNGWSTEPTINPATFAIDCANEILPIAQEAHKRLSFTVTTDTTAPCPHLSGSAKAPDDYATYAGSVAADEIQKAGHRLADLLQIILQ